MRDTNKIEINIIRHGKTILNERHCYIGVTDESLSENGIREIISKKEAGLYDDIQDVDCIFVSPMRRAKETARLIFPEKKMKEIDNLIEMDFGSFEGKCYEELKDNLYYRKWIDESRGVAESEIKEIYKDIYSDMDSSITLPEDKNSFTERVIKGICDVISVSKEKTNAVIVAHGGTIMALTGLFESEEYYKFMVPCGSGINVTVEYTEDDNGNIKISCFSINNRICS